MPRIRQNTLGKSKDHKSGAVAFLISSGRPIVPTKGSPKGKGCFRFYSFEGHLSSDGCGSFCSWANMKFVGFMCACLGILKWYWCFLFVRLKLLCWGSFCFFFVMERCDFFSDADVFWMVLELQIEFTLERFSKCY